MASTPAAGEVSNCHPFKQREITLVTKAVRLLLATANLRGRRQQPGSLPSRVRLSTTSVPPKSAPRARSLSDILQSSLTFRHQTFQTPYPSLSTNILHQFLYNSNTKWRPVFWCGITYPTPSVPTLMMIWAALTWCSISTT